MLDRGRQFPQKTMAYRQGITEAKRQRDGRGTVRSKAVAEDRGALRLRGRGFCFRGFFTGVGWRVGLGFIPFALPFFVLFLLTRQFLLSLLELIIGFGHGHAFRWAS